MSTSTTMPPSGYAILKVYVTALSLTSMDLEDLPSTAPNGGFGWDWRYVSPTKFEVKITVVLEADKSRPYRATTTLVGRFRQLGDSQTVSLDDFVSLQAVAILLPYARQYLANMTINTATGAYHLPTVNVAELMAAFNKSETTGAAQKRDGLIPEGAPPIVSAKRAEKPSKRRK